MNSVSRNKAVYQKYITVMLLYMIFFSPATAMKRLPPVARHSPTELFDSAKYYLEKRNSPDSALLFLTAITTLFEADPDYNTSSPIYPIAYQTKGAIYASAYGNYSDATINLLKGLELARNQNLLEWENRIRFNLDAMEYEQGRLIGKDLIINSTLSNFSDMIGKLKVPDDQTLAVVLLLNVSEIGIREGHYGRVKEAFKKLNPSIPLDSTVGRMAEVAGLLSSSRMEEACDVMDTIISNLATKSSYMGSAENETLYVIRAHTLLTAGKEKEALEAYDKIIKKSEASNDLFTVFEIYDYLRRYSDKKGNRKDAIDYELKELRTKDRLINRSRSLSFEHSKAVYNEEKLGRDIVIAVAKGRTYKIVFWISIGFLTIVMVLLAIIYRKLRQLRRSREIIVRNDKEFFKETMSEPRNTKSFETLVDNKAPEQRLYERIVTSVTESEEIYDEEFNTGRLAELVNEKPGAVSAAIMSASGETTSQFIARVRIREACRRMNDKANYGGYTIEGIGQSVGYRSRSHFGSIFKKIVGMTPSEYGARLKS